MSLMEKVVLSIALFVGLFCLAGLHSMLVQYGGLIQQVNPEGTIAYSVLLFASILVVVFLLKPKKRN